MAVPGSNDKLNSLQAVGGVIVTGTDEITTSSVQYPPGIAIYNRDTKELKITNGVMTPSELPDHCHPYTHAPLIHTHLFGTNQPWLVSEPRLWYKDDLVNHPELVALDGSEISDDRAQDLSKVYPSTRLLTKPVVSDNNTNAEIVISADTEVETHAARKVFGPSLTGVDIARRTDQWLTGDADVNTAHSITVQFRNDHVYRPTSYTLIPASSDDEGLRLALLRPTPKSWTFEGMTEEGSWEVLDTQTDITDGWAALSPREFTVNTIKAYSQLRIVISAWNEGEDAGLTSGLKRFWIYGRKNNVFNLPAIPSPAEDFVWVVPYSNINTGLKHEDVGDVATTAVAEDMLPVYRLPADGRVVNKSDYPELFSVIGNQYSTAASISNSYASEGAIEGGKWNANFNEEDVPSYIEYTVAPSMLSSFSIDKSGYRQPVTWTVEAKAEAEEDFDTLFEIENLSPEDFAATGGHFYIDTANEDKNYTTYRLNFLEWATGEEPIGVNGIQLYTRQAGKFALPTVSLSDQCTTYIVSRNNADDVSTDVIQKLQANVASLASALAALQNQVNNLDDSIKKPTTETEGS